MKTIIHPADERGFADHGWLKAKHSFSFANWYNPDKVHFGMLRVLNDDIVAGGKGFGAHPHNDMEIITIILEGALEHKDNMGNGSVIRPGDVQVMSAGKGVVHSEFNPDPDKAVNLFQLWIFPKEQNIEPRYDQKTFDRSQRKNQVQKVASGFGDKDALYIHQDAVVALADLEDGKELVYMPAKKGNGIYLVNINGEIEAGGRKLGRRDAAGFSELDTLTIRANKDSEMLIIDVPMR